MREIKFRWLVEDEFVYTDKINEYDFDCFITIENGEICLNCESGDDDFIGMKYEKADNETKGQFTGLKDANGVCIYEGDILQDEEYYLSKVYWDEEDHMWACTDVGGLCDICASIEVIGNIHQNPELLEK